MKNYVAKDKDFEWITTRGGLDGYVASGQPGTGFYRYIGSEPCVVIPDRINGHKLTSYYGMFKEVGTETSKVKLKKVISNNPNITSAKLMFEDAVVDDLDLSDLNISNVLYTDFMFLRVIARSIDLSGFDTSQVLDVSYMFSHAKIHKLNLKFDTSSTLNACFMFYKAKIRDLSLSGFDMSKVIDSSYMFACFEAKTLDLTGVEMSSLNVKTMFNKAEVSKAYVGEKEDIDSLNKDVGHPYLHFTTKTKRTEDLLKDTEIKVENLGGYLKESGVIVNLSFGGGRNSYKVPLKVFGVKESKLSEDAKEFFDNHTREGTVLLIPESESKKLRSIEAKTQKRLREVSAGYNGRFVPIGDLEDFVDYFDRSKEEYMAIRDELVENYDNMIRRFKKILGISLADLNVEEANKEYRLIINKIPSRGEFMDSFRAEMSISLLPTAHDFDVLNLDKETKEIVLRQYQELGENLIGDSTALTLQEAIDSLSSVINGYNKSGKIHHTVIKSLKNCEKRMTNKNIFGNNKLEEIRDNVVGIINLSPDMMVQQAEMVLSKIYMYSKELNIDEKINLRETSFTADELEALYYLYN